MSTYLMFGKYSMEAVKAVSAERTEESMALVKENGGTFKGGYALLGDIDLVLIVDLPDTEHAMKTSAALEQPAGHLFQHGAGRQRRRFR